MIFLVREFRFLNDDVSFIIFKRDYNETLRTESQSPVYTKYFKFSKCEDDKQVAKLQKKLDTMKEIVFNIPIAKEYKDSEDSDLQFIANWRLDNKTIPTKKYK